MLPREFSEALLKEIKNNPQACNSDVIPQGYGHFGLDKTNPVPVYGIPSSKFYLDRLKYKDGNYIRYRRNRNLTVSNITNLIDEYDIFNDHGEKICMLYISPYHWKTSEKAPDGFYLD